MHSSRRDAFRAINAKPIATVDYKKNSINYHSKDYLKKSDSTLKICLMKESLKIGVLKAHPNMFSSEVLAYKGYDGLIVEGTGLGHMPINVIDDSTDDHEKILRAVKQVVKKTVVVMAPQTIYGRLQMNVYSTGRDLLNVGIIGNLCDITPETAFIKLAFLLSTCPKDKVPVLMTSNLRGELSERIEDEDFLN